VRKLRLALLLVAASTVTAAAVTACVGDDPAAVVTPGDEGGTVPGSEGGSPGSDGSTPTSDSSTAGDGAVVDAADGATPAFDVKTIAGLRLWLESTKNVTKNGNDIVSWADSSGRWADGGAGSPDGGPHTAYPIQFTGGGANYPGVVANGIAGRASVTFESGPKLSIANHDDFSVGTGDFFVAVVAAISSGGGTLWRLTTATSGPSGVYLSPEKGCSLPFGARGAQPKCTSPDYAPNTAPHLFVLRRKAAQEIFRVDGTSRGTLDFGVTNPDLSVSLFQTSTALIGGGVVAQMSELLVVVGPTTDASLDGIEAHLKTKYAIP